MVIPQAGLHPHLLSALLSAAIGVMPIVPPGGDRICLVDSRQRLLGYCLR